MPVAIAGESNQFQDSLDPALDLGRGYAPQLQAESKVLEHVHMGPQRVALEDHAGGPLFGWQASDVLAVDGDLATRWCFEAADHAQQRRLTRAGRTQKADELAVGDIEGEAVDGTNTAREELGDVIDLEDGHTQSLRLERGKRPLASILTRRTRVQTNRHR